MAVYARQIASALRAITEKGSPCVWATKTDATSDPETPWIVVPGEIVTYPDTPIVFFPLSRQWSELIRYLKGTDVVTGSVYGLMPAVPFLPKLTDTVTRPNGDVMSPITIDPLSPNDEIILYTIEFRK